MRLSILRRSVYAFKTIHSICRDRTKFQYTLMIPMANTKVTDAMVHPVTVIYCSRF
jgi:hypothetical protein